MTNEKKKIEMIQPELKQLSQKQVELEKTHPPPVPEKSKSPFYSHTLRSLNFDYPPDQMGFYLANLIGIGVVSKAYWRSYNIRKALTAIQMGVEDDIDVYLHRSGLNEERHVYRAMRLRHRYVRFAFVKWVAIVASFTVFVQLKNKNRFDK
jgi:hypothetical protein